MSWFGGATVLQCSAIFRTIRRWPAQMPPARVPCGAAVRQMPVSAALAGPYAAGSHGQVPARCWYAEKSFVPGGAPCLGPACTCRVPCVHLMRPPRLPGSGTACSGRGVTRRAGAVSDVLEGFTTSGKERSEEHTSELQSRVDLVC